MKNNTKKKTEKKKLSRLEIILLSGICAVLLVFFLANYISTRPIDVPCGHTYELKYSISATCLEDGSNGFKCVECGENKVFTIPKTGHQYTEITIEPACETAGRIEKQCSCGDTILIEEIPALEHDYVLSEMEESCDKEGFTIYTCSFCQNITTETVPALGHSIKVNMLEPTCTQNGTEVSTCERCGFEESETLKARGHKFSNGRCERCGEKEKTESGSATLISLGKFKITGYCPCKSCSGRWGRQTSSGATAKANHTIAADILVLPYDTKVRINGKDYVVEDTGSAIKGNKIDIFFENHSQIKEYFKNNGNYVEIFIVEE